MFHIAENNTASGISLIFLTDAILPGFDCRAFYMRSAADTIFTTTV
jgi:hypothetical protein